MARRSKRGKSPKAAGKNARSGITSGVGRVLAPTASAGNVTKPPTVGGPTTR